MPDITYPKPFSAESITLSAEAAFARMKQLEILMTFGKDDGAEDAVELAAIAQAMLSAGLLSLGRGLEAPARSLLFEALDWQSALGEGARRSLDSAIADVAVALMISDPSRSPEIQALEREFSAYLADQELPEGSADELIHGDLSPEQRSWITAFINRWEAAEVEESKAPEGMRAVRWQFDGCPIFPGYHDGTYWNGFPNISVSPEVWAKVEPMLIEDLSASYEPGTEDYEDAVKEIKQRGEPDARGLCSLAYGYTPDIVGE